MKRYVLLLSFVILLGCSDKKTVNNLIKDSPNTGDSIISINQDDKELIYDFYFRFGSNNDFQLSRIKFPIQIQQDHKTDFVNKNDWKHDYLFLKLQYATHISEDNKHVIDFSADYGDKSIFSWIYPAINKKKDYYFIRENSQWYLSKIVISIINPDDPENFINFLHKFMNDSLFQLTRTKFPFEIKTWIGYEEEARDTTYVIEKSEWKFMSLYNGLDSLTNFSNDWSPGIQDQDQLIVFVGGVENGISVFYYFQKINNLWHFFKIEDSST
jgi:hypothetical protein